MKQIKRSQFDENSFKELIQQYPCMGALPPKQFALDLKRDAQAIYVAARTCLFEEGGLSHGYPLILDGEIRVTRLSRTGRSVELYRVSPGEVCLFSTHGLLGNGVMTATGVTTIPTRLLLLTESLFDKLNGHLPFRRFVFDALGQRVADLMAIIDELAFQSLDQRLASFLLGQGHYVRATHQTIATELGTVREIVTRILNRFAEWGLVKLRRECVEIVDARALRVIASGGDIRR